MKQRNESQAHGFIWEDEIKKNVYKINTTQNYTGIYDIPADQNKIDGMNVSIKTTQGKNVDMGEIARFFKSVSALEEKGMNMIVLIYKQIESKKVLQKVIELNLIKSDINLLFNSLTLEEIEIYVDFIKNIPKGKEDEKIKKERFLKQDLLNKKSGFIKLRTKVDSKIQRRVQCSFPDFLGFCDHVPERFTVTDGKLHGVQLTNKLESPPRKRNKEKQLQSIPQLINNNKDDLHIEEHTHHF